MDLIVETYDKVADAIGWAAVEDYEIVGAASTGNVGLIVQGFTETLFVMASGVKWTVHEDPRSGRMHVPTDRPINPMSDTLKGLGDAAETAGSLRTRPSGSTVPSIRLHPSASRQLRGG